MPAKILYIEDDDLQRRQLTEALQSRNFAITAAKSGQEGIQHLQAQLPEVILCDVNMPEMNGIEVLRQVQQIAPNIPIILLTAHGSVPLAVQAMNQGAYDFILKPLQLDEIVATLQNALEKTALQNEIAKHEARYQTLVDNIPDIVYSLSPAGDFLRLNSAVNTVLGYPISELIGTSFLNLVHADDRERVRQGFTESILAGIEHERTVRFRMLTKSGAARHFEVRGRAFKENEKIIRSDGIARDISERIELEDKLKQYSADLEDQVSRRTESLTFANRQLTALNSVSNLFSQIKKETELLETVPRLLTEKLEFDRALLFLDQSGLQLHSFASATVEFFENFKQHFNEKKIEIPEPFLQSFETNATILLPGALAAGFWPPECKTVLENNAIIISPIRVQNHPIGLIVGILRTDLREIDAQDVARFEMFANMVSLSLDNIRAYHSLEEKVIQKTDSLRKTYQELDEKANELQRKTYLLANANVQLLAAQEALQEKNTRMTELLAALAKSRDQLQAILDSTPNVVVMISAENRVVAVNRGIESFFGIPVDEVLHQDFNIFLGKLRKCFTDYDTLIRMMAEVEISVPDFRTHESDPAELFKLAVPQTYPRQRIVVPISIPVASLQHENLGKIWIFNDVTSFERQHE